MRLALLRCHDEEIRIEWRLRRLLVLGSFRFLFRDDLKLRIFDVIQCLSCDVDEADVKMTTDRLNDKRARRLVNRSLHLNSGDLTDKPTDK